MKTIKSFSIVLTFIIALSLGHAEDDVSRNYVGFVRIDLPPAGGRVFTSANFRGLNGTALTLASVFGSHQLIRDELYARADKIYIWNMQTMDYDRYAQKPSGAFYAQKDWLTGNPVDPVLSNGIGVWLQSSPMATNARSIYIAGAVVSNAIASRVISPGYQAVGAFFSSDVIMTNTDWLSAGAAGNDIAANADQIVVWTGADFERYGLAANGNWYAWTNWVTQGGTPVERIITMGRGAWYLSMANAPWNWIDPRPYPLP